MSPASQPFALAGVRLLTQPDRWGTGSRAGTDADVTIVSVAAA